MADRNDESSGMQMRHDEDSAAAAVAPAP
jgi:hypothetical protein